MNRQTVYDYQSILTELSESNTKSLNIKVGKRLTILILVTTNICKQRDFRIPEYLRYWFMKNHTKRLVLQQNDCYNQHTMPMHEELQRD